MRLLPCMCMHACLFSALPPQPCHAKLSCHRHAQPHVNNGTGAPCGTVTAAFSSWGGASEGHRRGISASTVLFVIKKSNEALDSALRHGRRSNYHNYYLDRDRKTTQTNIDNGLMMIANYSYLQSARNWRHAPAEG